MLDSCAYGTLEWSNCHPGKGARVATSRRSGPVRRVMGRLSRARPGLVVGLRRVVGLLGRDDGRRSDRHIDYGDDTRPEPPPSTESPS